MVRDKCRPILYDAFNYLDTLRPVGATRGHTSRHVPPAEIQEYGGAVESMYRIPCSPPITLRRYGRIVSGSIFFRLGVVRSSMCITDNSGLSMWRTACRSVCNFIHPAFLRVKAVPRSAPPEGDIGIKPGGFIAKRVYRVLHPDGDREKGRFREGPRDHWNTGVRSRFRGERGRT